MRALLCALLAASIVSGCGGGGSSSYDELPGENLAIQLVTTGVANPTSPLAPGGQVLITSSVQLTQFAAGRFVVPDSLANFDYTRGTVVYVEGSGDGDFTSVARLSQIRRAMAVDSLTSEICRTLPPTAGMHRPFALYTTPNILNASYGSATTFGFFPCVTVSRLSATLVASGTSGSFQQAPPTFIRDAATLAQATTMLNIAPIAPPDFSQVMLVLLTTLSDAPGAYIRPMGAYLNVDSSRDVVAEFCGFSGHPDARPYAFVEIPASPVDPRVVLTFVNPPNCLTLR
jgi:hypothetical protein